MKRILRSLPRTLVIVMLLAVMVVPSMPISALNDGQYTNAEGVYNCTTAIQLRAIDGTLGATVYRTISIGVADSSTVTGAIADCYVHIDNLMALNGSANAVGMHGDDDNPYGSIIIAPNGPRPEKLYAIIDFRIITNPNGTPKYMSGTVMGYWIDGTSRIWLIKGTFKGNWHIWV